MKVHIVVDYSFLYYKYKFQLEAGRMRRLTQSMVWHGVNIEKDVSQIYYSIKEIESFRQQWESAGHDITVSVCFDMPSKRKESNTDESDKYKSNRGGKLDTDDFDNIQFVKETLDSAGYNTYKLDGFEADDIVAHLVAMTKGNFDYTVIYTPDADLLVNIDYTVGAERYKSKMGYTFVTHETLSDYISKEMKCNIPYNALMLFKCTVGDKSDCIDGIKGFGPKAFDKLVDHLSAMGAHWEIAGNYEAVKVILENCKDYFTEDQMKQALASLELVKPSVIDSSLVTNPTNISTPEKRRETYLKYNFKSLVD